jgi:hypothetical protein
MPRTMSVFEVLRKIERGSIDLSPDFQRNFVWDPVRQSRLVESVLLKIPSIETMSNDSAFSAAIQPGANDRRSVITRFGTIEASLRQVIG